MTAAVLGALVRVALSMDGQSASLDGDGPTAATLPCLCLPYVACTGLRRVSVWGAVAGCSWWHGPVRSNSLHVVVCCLFLGPFSAGLVRDADHKVLCKSRTVYNQHFSTCAIQLCAFFLLHWACTHTTYCPQQPQPGQKWSLQGSGWCMRVMAQHVLFALRPAPCFWCVHVAPVL